MHELLLKGTAEDTNVPIALMTQTINFTQTHIHPQNLKVMPAKFTKI
jgi:hypothetical protein